MLKQNSPAFHRVSKQSSTAGKFVSKEQSGASGRTVISVSRSTYNKGIKAASKLIKEKA